MRWTVLCAAVLLAACATEAAPTKAKSKPVVRDEAPDDVTYGRRDDVMAFAAGIAERHGWEPAALEATLAAARMNPRVAKLIMPPPAGSAKNWAAYRDRFVEPQRIAAGTAFWRDNAAWLAKAEERFGVPASIVVGILGVETYYGRITGGFRVLDALATLSFDFPSGRSDRSPFFRSELEQFLVWCRREKLDPATVRGSYAGAIGLPQFMPGSINRHAVDFDGDGRVDLAGSPADAIGSIANYLGAHGWRAGMPTHYAVAAPVATVDRAVLLAPDITPTFVATQFEARGAVLDAAGRAHAGPLALVELQNGDAAPSYVAGTENFYAVTRYNWSSYYAMAVIELGAAVAKAAR